MSHQRYKQTGVTFPWEDFTRAQYVPNQWAPIIQTRQVTRRKIGTRFFGLFKVYEYSYTEWKSSYLGEKI